MDILHFFFNLLQELDGYCLLYHFKNYIKYTLNIILVDGLDKVLSMYMYNKKAIIYINCQTY